MIHPPNTLCSACVLVDGDGECVCVTLYNMVCSAHVNIGDVLVIPSPSIHHVLLPNLVSIVAKMARDHVIRSPLSLQEVDYWCVRVLQPQVVSYNGGRLPNT